MPVSEDGVGELAMTNRTQARQVPLMAAVNDVIDDLHGSLGLGDSDFFCECDHIGCKERMTFTRDEFAQLRRESQPVVVAAHAHRLGAAPAEVLELRGTVRQLQEALDSRVVIEQAKGVLAERSGITLDSAFELLRRLARNQRRKLQEVCAEMVASVESDRPTSRSSGKQRSMERSAPHGRP